ncbi:hypothetical protein [Streptomyces sp. ITFR-6]|uniref:hypothetical protein n=1 Tax=Streptomyces sp. ITFR-6 TaxID=3075197 RepID=UPI00288B2544|nr:hypothetical protein [Streptomyces sp. ITFR-6]WNI29804.1 hypothetical protein RLT59_14140 [Streptomyces sp. ITFR-6]
MRGVARARRGTAPASTPKWDSAVKNFDLEDLETLFIFTPSPGKTWGLTFTHLKQRLLETDPEVFMRVEDPRDGNSPGESFMFFEFTLEGK